MRDVWCLSHYYYYFGGNLTYHFSSSFCIENDNLQIKITFSSVDSNDRYLCSIFNVLNEKMFY